MRSLHETVQSLVHVAYPVLFAWFLHAIRLLHVNFFFEISMEKSCFDVHLVYFQVKGHSNVQKNPSRFHACNRGICFSVVDARFSKPFATTCTLCQMILPLESHL